jgi:type III secretion protein T
MESLHEIFWAYAQPLLFGLPRIGMMLLVLSALPNAIVPQLVRGTFAFSLLLGLYPLLNAQIQPFKSQGAMYFLLFKELGVGALLGIALGSIFWVIQSVGTLIDNQVGTSAAEVFDPFGGHAGGPWAEFTSILCVVLFVVLGGFHVTFNLLAESYVVWPLSSELLKLNIPLNKVGEDLASNVAAHGLRLAMPVIFLLCIVELGFGLINRAAPQLNVFMLSMPVKAVLATLVIALSFSHFVSAVLGHFSQVTGWLSTVSGVPILR